MILDKFKPWFTKCGQEHCKIQNFIYKKLGTVNYDGNLINNEFKCCYPRINKLLNNKDECISNLSILKEKYDSINIFPDLMKNFLVSYLYNKIINDRLMEEKALEVFKSNIEIFRNALDKTQLIILYKLIEIAEIKQSPAEKTHIKIKKAKLAQLNRKVFKLIYKNIPTFI